MNGRWNFLVVSALLLCACAESTTLPLPPSDRFDYPGSLKYAVAPDGVTEVLYVANQNLDVGFQRGSVIAASLAALPPFGTVPNPAATVHPIGFGPDGGVTPDNQVFVDNFVGIMDSAPIPNGLRLFVPTRQNANLFVVDANGPSLGCAQPDGTTATGPDCASAAIAMYQSDQNRQVQTFCAHVVGSSVYVGDLESADYPSGSVNDFGNFLAVLQAGAPFAGFHMFLTGPQPVYEMAAVGSKVYLSSAYPPIPNYPTTVIAPIPLRQFDTETGVSREVWLNPLIAISYTKGVAASCDASKLYVITNAPDALAVMDMTQTSYAGGEQTSVIAPVLRFTQIPAGASEMKVVCRPGRGDLVVISSVTSNTVSFYDEDAGQVVAIQRGFDQPFGLAVATGADNKVYGSGARIFVGALQRGTIDVLDMPDLNNPQDAVITAHLGCPYVCPDPTLPECSGC